VLREKHIPDIFPKHLFWDVDYSGLDVERDRSFIIPRALYATTVATFVDDIEKLENLYTKEEILKELRHTREFISNRVCELVADRYQVPVFHRFKR
jgi:hypothetical protein